MKFLALFAIVFLLFGTLIGKINCWKNLDYIFPHFLDAFFLSNAEKQPGHPAV
jgi:hypothetical protein